METDMLDAARGMKSHEKINWLTTSIMVAFHLGAIAALFFFSWKNLALALALWWVAGSLGIGLGYHRLLTHRGFKVPRWLERTFAICATLALEGGPIFWVAVHRIHHQNTDKPGDPHSPRDGKWWSHAGWILTGETLHENTRELMRYTPDLAKDKFYVNLTKYHWVPITLLGFALLAFGGYQAVLWGIFLRTVVGLHTTWLVNSATHLWGSRRFATKDDSTNNFWVALLSFGEGWHNNHHAHPTSARHGIRWYEIDFNWYLIAVLKRIGLAKNVKALSWPLPASAMRIGLVDSRTALPRAEQALRQRLNPISFEGPASVGPFFIAARQPPPRISPAFVHSPHQLTSIIKPFLTNSYRGCCYLRCSSGLLRLRGGTLSLCPDADMGAPRCLHPALRRASRLRPSRPTRPCPRPCHLSSRHLP